jgi:hypothetical protein
MKRLHLILIGALVLQVGLAVLLYWPRGAQSVASEPLLGGLTAGDIVSLTVTDAQGERIVLRNDVGAWVMPEAEGYPASTSRVTPLLDKVVAIKTNRLVTRTEASHRQLEVADNYQRKVTLQGADGRSLTLLLGSSPAYGSTHVRLDGRSEVYLTDALSVWELGANPGAWIDDAYLELTADDITTFSLTNAQGTLVLHQAEGAWSLDDLPEGETLDQSAVSALVRRTAFMWLDEPLGRQEKPEYGLAEPLAVVTIATPQETLTLRVGRQDPETGSYVVSSSASPYIVTVSQFAVQDLVEFGMGDLMAQPTPDAAAPGLVPPAVGQ